MKQHNFKVGDRIERDDGQTCTVSRIDPACNNVYGKDFAGTGSLYRTDGAEISSVALWHVVTPAASDTPAELKYDTADLHIFTVQERGQYQGKTVLHEVIPASGARKAKTVVEQKAKTDLLSGVTYRAVVRFWDGDVCEFTFTVEQPKPENRVEFV